MMSDAVLHTEGLTRRFGGLVANNNIAIQIHRGQLHAVLGPNGAGKSTMINLLSGDLRPSSGHIFFDGQDVSHLDARGSAKLGIIQMPGGRSVFPTMTVNECLRLAGWLYKKHDKAHVVFRKDRYAITERGMREVERRRLFESES